MDLLIIFVSVHYLSDGGHGTALQSQDIVLIPSLKIQASSPQVLSPAKDITVRGSKHYSRR